MPYYKGKMKHDIPPPAAVFFDWDGTLVDSFAFLHRAHNHVRGILDMASFELEAFRAYFGMPREKLYFDMYGGDREQAKAHFEEYVFENHLRELSPMPGANALIEFLRRKKMHTGVVSNKKGRFLAAEINHFGWNDVFSAVVGAGEAAEDKPAAAPLLHALENSGFQGAKENVWYVGDTKADILCAKAAGCVSVFIENDKEKTHVKEDISPDVSFSNCAALKDFLLQYSTNTLKETCWVHSEHDL